jgi:hypothetical protein
MVDGFYVSIDELRRAENLVRELGQSLAESVSLKYSIDARQVGNEELAEAVTEFHDHSRGSTDRLCADAAEAAARLRDTAAEYENHDQAAAGLVAGKDTR